MEGLSDVVALKALNYAYNLELNSMLVSFGILAIMVIACISIFTPGKSKRHRELFADLYVVGKIRKFAKEDGIELKDELIELRKMEKLAKLPYRSLDKSIEEDLKEKLAIESQNKLEATK